MVVRQYGCETHHISAKNVDVALQPTDSMVVRHILADFQQNS